MATEVRKRSLDESVEQSRHWYYVLESESSVASQEDTESIYSIQNQETDIARDTSDTESGSDEDVNIEVEYDVATASESDNLLEGSSSGTDDALAYAGAIAAAICDSSLEAWATDAEDSDTSSMDEGSFGRTDFWTCVQCKSQNDNPLFRLCERCFQVRKSFFPPRPRRHKRVRSQQDQPSSSQEEPVKLESLKSCLSGLSSQDSGIGSSQEFPSLQLDKIVVPKQQRSSGNLSDNKNTESVINRKRQHSESSISDFEEVKNVKRSRTMRSGKDSAPKVADDLEKVVQDSEQVKSVVSDSEQRDLCIVCNVEPKNSIFLHGNIAHMCCCYKCAIRTWGTTKRCPVCNCKVKNVVKVFKV